MGEPMSAMGGQLSFRGTVCDYLLAQQLLVFLR
jgi:hypothetical protein